MISFLLLVFWVSCSGWNGCGAAGVAPYLLLSLLPSVSHAIIPLSLVKLLLAASYINGFILSVFSPSSPALFRHLPPPPLLFPFLLPRASLSSRLANPPSRPSALHSFPLTTHKHRSAPHIDDSWVWGERIAICSLLATCSMSFLRNGREVSVELPRRSLLIMAGAA